MGFQMKSIYLHLNTIICNGDNEQNKGVRPPRLYGVGYRGFCAEDEYIAVGDEKATGEGGAYQKPHTGLLRHFAYRKPRSRSERCR